MCVSTLMERTERDARAVPISLRNEGVVGPIGPTRVQLLITSSRVEKKKKRKGYTKRDNPFNVN